MMNSSYPFNAASSSMPETINALRAELEDKIKETIFETFGSNISQGELESLMDSFSPIIQRQVNKYARELNNLNQSVNYTTNVNNYQCYPYSNLFNEYSPMMPNNFVQNSQYDDIDSYVNSAIYGSNFQTRNNLRNKGTSIEPKPTKLRKANFRAKRQNIQKASKSFGNIIEPTKQTKTSTIQKTESTPKPIVQLQKAEPIQKQIEPTQKQIKPTQKQIKPTQKQIEPTQKQIEPIQKQIEQIQKVEPTPKQIEPTQKQIEPAQMQIEQIQKVELTPKQIEPIPQKPTISHTVESFNNLSLTDQLSAISSITDQSQQQTSIHSILSLLHEMNPTGSHYLSLQTKDNKMPLNSCISNIEQLDLSYAAIEQIIAHQVPLDKLTILPQTQIELKYPSEQFESAYKQCLNLKQSKETYQIRISILISGINKTDMRFKNDTNIYSVKFDSTVTEILGGNFPIGSNGGGSFSGCSSLEEVTIPSSLNLIGHFSFSKCTSLKRIILPSSLTSIENGVFFGCSSLTEITIPSSVRLIGGHCFNGCSKLHHISIPSDVTQIGPLCFNGCSSLTEIEIPSKLEVINANCFKDCSSLVRIIVPASVKVISENAFHGCKELKEIQMSPSLESIGEGAFSMCSSLTRCAIPDSVKFINDDVFNGCSSLVDLSLGSSIKSIGKGSFLGCQSLKQLTIPSSVTSIGKGALFGCSAMNQISIPNNLKLEETGLSQKVEIIKRNTNNSNSNMIKEKASNWSNKNFSPAWSSRGATSGWGNKSTASAWGSRSATSAWGK